MPSTWAGYTRVSRVGDRDETLISPELQAERIQSYANGRGLEVEMLRPELDVSGGRVERPVLSELLAAIEDGRYAGLIVAQLDRLSRLDLGDALATIAKVENAGGKVIAVAENFDADTPEGRMARNVMLSLGNMQLERYRAGFANSKRSAVERGVWPTNTAPIGYKVTRRKDGGDGRLYPDPRTRDKVERAFETRAAGNPWRDVARILGNGTSGAQKVIRNRVYLGELRLGEWVNASAHEPIVSRELWEAAQISAPRPPRQGNSPALLTGLVRCAGCGGSMSPNSSVKSSGVERIYRCQPHNKAAGRCGQPAIISQAKLDEHVEAFALAEIDRLAISGQERSRAVDAAIERLAEAEAERDAFQQVARVSELGAENFAAGMRSRVEAVEEARRDLSRARLAAGPLPAPHTLRELWPDLSIEERRHVLRGAIGALYVRRGRGPAADRVKVVAPGFEPNIRGAKRLALSPIPWDDNLPGEIRPALAENV